MPQPPIPLDEESQAKYDRLHRLFGKERADKFANDVGSNPLVNKLSVPPAVTPVAPPVAAPSFTIDLPKTGTGVTGVSPAAGVTGIPQGMEARSPTPPMQNITISLPSGESLQEQGQKARQIYKERRVKEIMAQGVSEAEAGRRADEEAYRVSTVPRTSEFGAKPVSTKPAGYSELAVRGPELLPKMSGIEATGQALLPQVLETEAQAEGRRAFERRQKASRVRLEEESTKRNIPVDALVPKLLAENDVEADRIVKERWGDNDPEYVTHKRDVLAAINAPMYAAVKELKPNYKIGDIAAEKSSDILRSLTQAEKEGRLVETRGAAAARNLGGLSRYLVRGAEEAIVKPLAKAAVAATTDATYAALTAAEEASRAAGGGTAPVLGVPGLKADAQWERRRKLDTGSFAKDVAFEIATGRSAMDDYYDAGMPTGLSTVVGLATEFAIPVTPIGAVTDVAPAFKSVAMGIKPIRMGAEALAASKLGAFVGRIADAPQVARLRAVAKSIKTPGAFGEAIADSNVFRQRFADAASVRSNIVETVAREAADISQTRNTILDVTNRGINKTPAQMFDENFNALVDLEDFSNDMTAAGGAFGRELRARIGQAFDEYRTAHPSGKFVEGTTDVDPVAAATLKDKLNDIRSFVEDAYKSGIESPSVPTRVAVASADELPILEAGKARDIESVRRKVSAEVLDLVPDDNYIFLTSRLIVKKSLLNDKSFTEGIRDATKDLPPTASRQDIDRAIEGYVKSNWKGSDVAETATMAIPRLPSEEGVLAPARGGIERMREAPSRRLTVQESYRDTVDTIKAATPEFVQKFGKPFGVDFDANKFANANFSSTGLPIKVPADIGNFMVAARSAVDNVPGRLYAAMGQLAKGGVVDALDTYATARIVEDAAGGNRGVFDTEFVGNSPRIAGVIDPATLDDAVYETVRLFFGADNLRFALGSDANFILKQIIQETAGPGTLRQRIVDVIDAVRADKAVGGKLNQAGMVRIGGTGGARAGVFTDDVNAALTQFIMTREAQAAFRTAIGQNIKSMPTVADLVADARHFVDDAGSYTIAGTDVTDRVVDAVNRYIDSNPEDFGRRLRTISDKIAGEFIYKTRTDRTISAFHLEGMSDLRAEIRGALEGIGGASRSDAALRGRLTREGVARRISEVRDEGAAAVRELEDLKEVALTEARERNVAINPGEPGYPGIRNVSLYEDRLRIAADYDRRIAAARESTSTRIEAIRDEAAAATSEGRIELAEMAEAGADVRGQIIGTAEQAVNDVVYTAISRRLNELADRFSMQRAAAGWTDYITTEALSEAVDLPLPAPLAAELRKYFGSLEDLRSMKGIIGDNIVETTRLMPASSAEGIRQRLGMILSDVIGTVKSLTASGLTAGAFAPNLRYHGVNFETAPLIQAVTSPAYVAQTLGTRLAGFLPSGAAVKFDVPAPSAIRAFRDEPGKVIFTAPNGVQWTAGQLNRLLDENFFGMSAGTVVLSERLLDDIIANTQTAVPFTGNKLIPKFNITALEFLRFANARGTNPWVRIANSTDRAWRQTAFMVGLKNGLTVEQSLSIARNAFLDYGKIPAELKTQFGKYMMFASWMLMSNMEIMRALLTKKGGAAIVKQLKAQRALHEESGDWMFEDDATKKRLWTSFVGDFDGVPAYDVGPENPAVGPMIDNIGPAAMQLYQAGYDTSMGESPFSSTATMSDGVNWLVKNSFTPGYQYLKDVGALGNAPISDIVPAKSIAAAQKRGPQYFKEWMDQNQITTVPYDKRRPGEPTFMGEQYMFTNEGAKEKWARSELLYTLGGIQRLSDDWKTFQLYLGNTPPGMDAKRFSGMDSMDVIQYMFSIETRQKGRTEYDMYMRAMQQAKRELSTGEGVPRQTQD